MQCYSRVSSRFGSLLSCGSSNLTYHKSSSNIQTQNDVMRIGGVPRPDGRRPPDRWDANKVSASAPWYFWLPCLLLRSAPYSRSFYLFSYFAALLNEASNIQ